MNAPCEAYPAGPLLARSGHRRRSNVPNTASDKLVSRIKSGCVLILFAPTRWGLPGTANKNIM